MGAPLIQLVQDATTELGLPVPSAVINALDNTGRQMGGLANRCGRLLMRMHDWTVLTREWHISIPPTITATCTLTANNPNILLPAGVAQQLLISQMVVTGPGLMTSTRLINVYPATTPPAAVVDQAPTVSGSYPITFRTDTIPQPADLERHINRTQWDRTMRWPLRGPQSPQWDQWVRSGIVATGPRRQFREINNSFRIWPAPATSDAGSQLIGEYVSNQWAMSHGGTAQPRFLNDQDTCVFDDDVMTTGIKFLFFSTKGFESDGLYEQWREVTRVAIASDGPKPTLDMSLRSWPMFISPANVQDTGFGNVP